MAQKGTQTLDNIADHGYAIPERMYENPERLRREEPMEITSEVQGN